MAENTSGQENIDGQKYKRPGKSRWPKIQAARKNTDGRNTSGQKNIDGQKYKEPKSWMEGKQSKNWSRRDLMFIATYKTKVRLCRSRMLATEKNYF
jgi:hypothetical protein